MVILWDAATQTEHFIRRASFKSEAEDFGFLVPTPTQPALNESGTDALCIPRQADRAGNRSKRRAPAAGWDVSCPCQWQTAVASLPDVVVLEDKMVAGFHAVVLETHSTVRGTWSLG